MIITEQAATVLQEIDEQLALADKATAGPWETTDIDCVERPKKKGFNVGNFPDAAFIATSRTLLPASLQIIRDDIKAWLELRDSLQVGRDDVTTWDFCNRRLTAILDAWEAAK